MSIEDILVVGHVISQLQQNEPLSAKFVDHPLSGNWNGFSKIRVNPRPIGRGYKREPRSGSSQV
ncbi:MAG: type II toxin-antitoxin system YafQ family toxin [Gammaproteobacteria bacterium]|nr:type II toxin-antitoxin system YafQ family toxin [Gammaproteobacteria bacterium]